MLEYHQLWSTQTQHKGNCMDGIDNSAHVWAYYSMEIYHDSQDPGTDKEVLMIQPLFPRPNILCLQDQIGKLGKSYGP